MGSAAALRLLALSALIVAAAGLHAAPVVARLPPASFVHSLAFNHKLRVCNAYPDKEGLDVFLNKDKISKKPLEYKSCQEYSPSLSVNDKVNFKVQELSTGSFTISELPQSDATMLLVISRHDASSSAVAFESHVFANAAAPQVAVLDTYKGKQASGILIQDAKGERSEQLAVDTVVAVNPGIYQVGLGLLAAGANNTKAKTDLVALPQESYVVVRVGVEATEGQSFPEELVVFPSFDRKAYSAAAGLRPAGLAVALSALAGALCLHL